MTSDESNEILFALVGIGVVAVLLGVAAWLFWRLVRFYRRSPASKRMRVVLGALAVFHLLGLVSFLTFPFDFDTPRSLYVEALEIDAWVFPALFAALWALTSLLIVLRQTTLHQSDGPRTLRLLAFGTCAVLAVLAFGIVDSMDNALPFLRQLGADLPAGTLFVIAEYQWWWLFPALAVATSTIVLANADYRGRAARFASGSLIGLVFLANASMFATLLSLFLPFFKLCGPMELSTGFTRLHAAAALGRVDSVRRQVAKGAVVDVRDESGTTPLLAAVSGGHLAIAQVLLERSADANAATGYGQTPMHAAAALGRTDIAEQLLARGARVDAKDWRAGQPLHRAAYRGHLAMATLLLDRGADVNAEDDQGATPLDQAVSGKQSLVADLIVQRGGIRSTKESRQRAAERVKTQTTAQVPFGSCRV